MHPGSNQRILELNKAKLEQEEEAENDWNSLLEQYINLRYTLN